MDAKGNIEGLDMEWVALILEAKELGLSCEDIREFLGQSTIVK
ncbi:anti-repressor SinI family protein [Ammoniphilus sp. YIM 78166]|nr:anti-repressor SinI family protein [Ammoniphilus sp. YIM 78166]